MTLSCAAQWSTNLAAPMRATAMHDEYAGWLVTAGQKVWTARFVMAR
ncbi:MAG: hypothetical protein KJZ58_03505 [Flavobacteriales bacterium]|nr:hypothetical protein [Flavobacteriales bacterium]